MAPWSEETDTATSYAYAESPLRTSQCAAQRPFASDLTDGKSAQLMNQSAPLATVTGFDHPLDSSFDQDSRQSSVPAGSSQLRTRLPSGVLLMSGNRLPIAPGRVSLRIAVPELSSGAGLQACNAINAASRAQTAGLAMRTTSMRPRLPNFGDACRIVPQQLR